MNFQQYDDDVTYKLAEAAADLLGGYQFISIHFVYLFIHHDQHEILFLRLQKYYKIEITISNITP